MKSHFEESGAAAARTQGRLRRRGALLAGIAAAVLCAARLPAQTGEPLVLFVHGAGGTALRVPGSGVRRGWPDDVLVLLGSPPNLEFAEEVSRPRPDNAVSGRLRPAELLGDAPVLLRALRAERRRVRPFTYDFRYPISQIAAELGTAISALLAGSRGGTVDLVGHSMGGLVAAAYLAAHPDDSGVRRLVTIGTPFLGAPRALLALRHGDDLGAAVVDACKLKRAARNLPGLYGLLPGRAYFAARGPYVEERVDLDGDGRAGRLLGYDATTRFLKGARETRCLLLPGIDVGPRDRLNARLVEEEAVAFRERQDAWRPPDTVEVYAIAGYGLATPVRLVEDRRGVRLRLSRRGDDSVPLESAAGVDATAVYYADLRRIGAGHAGMVAAPAVIAQVSGLLREGSGLYGPNISTAPPRLGRRHMGGRAHGRAGTWEGGHMGGRE